MFKRTSIITSVFIIVANLVGNAFAVASVHAQTRNATRPRQAVPLPAAEVTVVLNEQFLNSFLDAMFINLRSPSFPLSPAGRDQNPGHASAPSASSSSSQDSCPSVIMLEREMDGVRTRVHFVNGQVVAPLAFSGSYYNSLIGCLPFKGWADTALNLEFNQERQVLRARVSIRDVHLRGVPSLANGPIVSLVQNAVDKRINPIDILQAGQLAAQVPITAAGGALRLRANEVRPEIVEGALRLHIFYDFIPAK